MYRTSPALRLLLLLWLTFPVAETVSADGLSNATVLLIRHAEKPEEGTGLTPTGEARAKAYAQYFNPLKLQSETLKLDAIFATADSKHSHRPRSTVEPLAQALGLSVNTSYKDDDYQSLVNALRARNEGKHVLVCWHHGMLPELLQALGADPNTLLPGGTLARRRVQLAVRAPLRRQRSSDRRPARRRRSHWFASTVGFSVQYTLPPAGPICGR